MYQTDKYNSGLIDFYSKLFKDIQKKPIKFLELGIYKGGSLLFWNDYFDKAEIVGIDIRLPELKVPSNIKIIKCGQGDKVGLDKIGKEYGQFDIILDDCSHHQELTQISFNVLWEYVKPGGMYIIEDWLAGTMGCCCGHCEGLENVVLNAIHKRSELKVKDLNAVFLSKQGSTAIITKK